MFPLCSNDIQFIYNVVNRNIGQESIASQENIAGHENTAGQRKIAGQEMKCEGKISSCCLISVI